MDLSIGLSVRPPRAGGVMTRPGAGADAWSSSAAGSTVAVRPAPLMNDTFRFSRRGDGRIPENDDENELRRRPPPVAPAFLRKVTTSEWPPASASRKGVPCHRSTAFTLAPAPTSTVLGDGADTTCVLQSARRAAHEKKGTF